LINKQCIDSSYSSVAKSSDLYMTGYMYVISLYKQHSNSIYYLIYMLLFKCPSAYMCVLWPRDQI